MIMVICKTDLKKKEKFLKHSMKRLVLVIGAFLMLQSFVCGQTYTTEKKDLFGNSTTTVKDQYGRTMETACIM